MELFQRQISADEIRSILNHSRNNAGNNMPLFDCPLPNFENRTDDKGWTAIAKSIILEDNMYNKAITAIYNKLDKI